jgi:hypothetical protein
VLHALPSSQETPSALPGFEHTPDCGLQTPTVWHESSAAQTVAVPVQAPAWQLSLAVQALASLQAVPSGLAKAAQPVAGSHTPAVWHELAAQITGGPPLQAPPWHVSVEVQALPSSHAVPFGFGVAAEHTPDCGLHTPAAKHGIPGAGQTTGFEPAHTPAAHVSVWVQPLPSLHIVPSGFAGNAQRPVCGAQVPAVWHAPGAPQTIGFAPTHTPLWQVSLVVQALPSLHVVPVSSVQVPSAVDPAATEHASHAPALQAVAQQTPSAQKPLAQSRPVPHAAAIPSGL